MDVVVYYGDMATLAKATIRKVFENGLIVEKCGYNDQIVPAACEAT